MFGLVYFFLEYIGEGPECPFQKFTNAGDSMWILLAFLLCYKKDNGALSEYPVEIVN